MSKGIDITPNLNSSGSNYPEIQFGGLSSSTVSLVVGDSGVVSYIGSYGTLSYISDNLNGVVKSIYSPTGQPLFLVRSDDYVQMGKYSSSTLVANSNRVGFGLTAPSTLLHIYGSPVSSFRLEDGNQQDGYFLTSDSNGVASWKKGPTAISATSFNGTLGYLSKFTATSSVGDSVVYNGSNFVSIGTVSTSAVVVIAGTGSTSSTNSLVLGNISSSNILSVRDDGYVSSYLSGVSSKLVYGGVIYNNTSVVSNTATGSFVNLYNVQFLANNGGFILKNIGDKLKSVFSGEIYATSSSSQQIKVSCGGVDIFQSGTFSLSGSLSYWKVESLIIAIDNVKTIKSMSRLTVYKPSTATNLERISVGTFSVTGFSSRTDLNISVNTTGSLSDIVGRVGYVEYYPTSVSSTFSYTTPPPPVFNPFKMTIDTGVATDFELPLNTGYTYDAIIDWGDGTTQSQTTDVSPSHTYSSPGVYQIQITGDFPSIFFNATGNRLMLVSIDQWGDVVWETMDRAFDGCENMSDNYSDYPNISSVTSMEYMFRNCYGFNGYVDDWDVSSVTSMGGLFFECSIFDQELKSWQVGNVIDMNNMFINSQFNRNINSWDVSSVNNMGSMFQGTPFNKPLDSWNVESLFIALSFMDNPSYNQDFLRDIYLAWSALPILQTSVFLEFQNISYTQIPSDPPPNKNSGKDILIGTYGWIISDNGPV